MTDADTARRALLGEDDVKMERANRRVETVLPAQITFTDADTYPLKRAGFTPKQIHGIVDYIRHIAARDTVAGRLGLKQAKELALDMLKQVKEYAEAVAKIGGADLDRAWWKIMRDL